MQQRHGTSIAQLLSLVIPRPAPPQLYAFKIQVIITTKPRVKKIICDTHPENKKDVTFKYPTKELLDVNAKSQSFLITYIMPTISLLIRSLAFICKSGVTIQFESTQF
eukprot:363590_1